MQFWKCLRSGLAKISKRKHPFLGCFHEMQNQGAVTHLDPCFCLAALVVLPLPRLDRSHLHPRPLQRPLLRLQPTASASTFPPTHTLRKSALHTFSVFVGKKDTCEVNSKIQEIKKPLGIFAQGGSARINDDSNSHLDPCSLLQGFLSIKLLLAM